MKYQDRLSQSSNEYCRLIAYRNDLHIPTSDVELRSLLLSKFTDETFLKNVVNRLSRYERTALKILMLSCGDKGIPFEQFNNKIKSLSISNRNAGQILRALTESGIAVIVSTEYLKHRYLIPEDVRAIVMRVFMEEINKELQSPSSAPQSVRNDGWALIRDTFAFLSYLQRNEVKITQHGVVYKRNQTKIIKQFEIADDIPKIFNDINPNHEWSDRLKFIFLFCEDTGLIATDDYFAGCTHTGEKWTAKTDADKLRDIYDYWYRNAPAREAHSAAALSLLTILYPSRWVLVSSLQQYISKFTTEYIWPEMLFSRLECSVFNILTYLGILSFAIVDTDIAIQVTDLGRNILTGEAIEPQGTEHAFIIQPNYEILASSYLEPEIRWNLKKIAELHKAGQMNTYKLTKKSIYEALKTGMTAAQILDFLRSYSKTELPQNVEYAIVEWTKLYGRIHFMESFLLRCDDEALAQELKASKRIGKFILGELTPKDLVVAKKDYEQLVKLLEEEGYMPKAGIVNLEA